MSQIEKLQIEGIRSYGEPAVIEFFTPLTLIVGANGAGKTTIIEALNYITTGDMPPNSKGAAFVFDPKVAGEQEVKGQVKLMLKDVSGNRVIVTRSLISTQKLKKVECKSLENVIKRNINKEWQSISSKCADINREMITCLGVSKPVLDCVIFCHQEDSMWPLSEGKVLKTRFDEIFAATRYIKALEAIRKFRKDQATEVKQFKTELEYLKANKEKADEIAENLEKTSKKLEETQSEVEEIRKSMKPVDTRLSELGKVHQNLNQLEQNLGLFNSQKKQLQSMDRNIRGKITQFFQGSARELERFFKDFETELKRKEEQLKQTEDHLSSKNREHSSLSSEKNAILVNHGKLQQEAERHKANVNERDTMMVEQSKMFQFSGFDNPPFSEEKVATFMQSTKDKYQKLVQEGKDLKQACQERIDSLQCKIDGIRKTLCQHEETIRIKNNLLSDNQKKLRQVGHDLGNVDASAKKLQRIDKELKTAEKELEDTKGSGNIGQWKVELEESQKEKRRVDSELSRLRDEQQAMHLQSTAQAKLDMCRKQKEAKEDAIQKIVDRHEEQLRAIFGACGPVDTLKTRVSKFLQDKRTEHRNMYSNIQKLRQQQSSKQAEIRMTSDQIQTLEKSMAGYKSKIKEACGEEDYATLKENMYDAIEQAKSKCSQLAAFQTIYKKYISNMEEKQNEPCCPLCHRQFDALKEMQNLVDELKDKISKVPDKMRVQQDGLQRNEAIHEKLQKLTSVKDNLEDIEKNKLPITKAKMSKLSEELKDIDAKIEESEDVGSVIESELGGARHVEPDLIMLEEHQRTLKSLDKEMSLLQAKMEGVVTGRSMQVVTNEISDRQDRVDGLSRVVDRKRNQISQLESQLASLTSNVHELSSEKLRLTGELQRRTHLEDQKAELSAANMEHEREIKEAERQIQPIKTSLQEQEQQHKSQVVEQETHVETTNAQLNEIKGYVNKLKDKMSEIRKYLNDNRETALEKIKERLSGMNDKLKTVTQDKKRLSSEIDEFKDDLSRQQVRARELQDNIQLFEIEEKISQLNKNISRVEREQGELGNVAELRREQSTLQKQLDTYHKQKATCQGRLTGYEEELTRFQKELNSALYKDADMKHRKKLIEIKTTELANDDLEKYYKALDRAIMKFHSLKMEEINKIVKEYWINTYKGSDIDTVEIRSHDEDAERSSITARRSYNYKVVMIKGDVALDMRGRCSAGQKVLASLIIRLALAETFCLSCGILALDEPTTNLDDENIESLANQLASIVRTRNPQKNFQLIVITHDEHFVELLGQADFVEYYYRVAKDDNQISRIYKNSTSGVETT